MYGKQLLQRLRTYAPKIPMAHFQWSKAPDDLMSREFPAYGVLTEDAIKKISFDTTKSEQVLECTIDVFVADDLLDEAKAMIEAVLDTSEIAYSFDMDFDENGSLIHLVWNTQCIYGDGIIPLRKLTLTDLNEHLTSGYDTVQVVDVDLVAENVKKDVNILGVVGTFEGSETPEYEGGYIKQSKIDATQTFDDVIGTKFNEALQILPNTKETLPGQSGYTYIIH